jgi:PTS system nitrogen regulatory IIA component
MTNESFSIESLADYLHLPPEQVARLAERGKLPGRRIGGQWRFSPAEIHHWWEQRIGMSDDEELAEVESALQRFDDSQPPPLCLADMFPLEGIAIPLDARTRTSVISAMVRLAGRTGLLWNEEKMEEAVRARENLHPTALDNGVALLHPRRPLASIIAEPFLAFGRTGHGIPFGGSHALTDLFFLICSREDRGHLRVLARLSRLIADGSFLVRLRDLADRGELVSLVREYERQLPE